MQLPTSHPAVAAAVALAALACGELLTSLPASLESLGSVAGAAERLGHLATPRETGAIDAPEGALDLVDVDVAAAAEGPVLLASVTLHVPAGRPVAVIGPSGSGKSTLLAAAAGLEDVRRGTVLLGGLDVATLEESSLRRRLGWLPAEPRLLEGTVRDVLDVGRGLGDDALRDALERVGLTEALGDRGGLDAVVGPRGEGLSGGERRRLALARLLAGGPDVYVLDEPTAGLDGDASRSALDAVAATGAAVLLATHDAGAGAWADTRRVVREGRLE